MGFGLRFPIFGHAWCSYVGHAFSCWYFLRDRPFNLQGKAMGFFSFRNFFQTTQELEYYFFCRAKREFFFQNLTLGYMTKTLNQIIFFSLHQNQNTFFSNIGNQIIF